MSTNARLLIKNTTKELQEGSSETAEIIENSPNNAQQTDNNLSQNGKVQEKDQVNITQIKKKKYIELGTLKIRTLKPKKDEQNWKLFQKLIGMYWDQQKLDETMKE